MIDSADGNANGIAARRFDASGNPIGSEFVVNTYTTGLQIFGDLAVDADGDFVTVWEDFNLRDGSGAGIFGQRFDASGNRQGSEFQVNSYTTGNQRCPSISMAPAGRFVVAWSSQPGTGVPYGVFAGRFDAAGNPVGDDFVVNTYTTGAQPGPFGQVAHDAGGNFVVIWYGPGDGTLDGSFAQRFSASGARSAPSSASTPTPRASSYGRRSPPIRRATSSSPGTATARTGAAAEVFAQRFGGLAPAALVVDGAGQPRPRAGGTVDAGLPGGTLMEPPRPSPAP